jgi:hypothetical protein
MACCIRASVCDSFSTRVTSLRRTAARHGPIMVSYNSGGSVPGLGVMITFASFTNISGVAGLDPENENESSSSPSCEGSGWRVKDAFRMLLLAFFCSKAGRVDGESFAITQLVVVWAVKKCRKGDGMEG